MCILDRSRYPVFYSSLRISEYYDAVFLMGVTLNALPLIFDILPYASALVLRHLELLDVEESQTCLDYLIAQSQVHEVHRSPPICPH